MIQLEGLDLYCKAGGATKGYQLAGFRMTGVDNQPQPRYCGDEFIQMDVFEFLKTQDLSRFAFIHASPPCQAYSKLRFIRTKIHPDLVARTRSALKETGIPYIIENVVGAPLVDTIKLCGTMFGLRVLRHRLFESSVFILQPFHPTHPPGVLTGDGLAAHSNLTDHPYMTIGGHAFSKRDAQIAMGIDWMIRDEMSQAIPPAYTHYIARQLNTIFKRPSYALPA